MNTFRAVKVNTRLWIETAETGERIYTPPDFLRHRMQSREPIRRLAAAFTATGGYDIGAVIGFEASG